MKPPLPRAPVVFAWLGCFALLGLTALLWIGGDRWWPVFPFLFGPRFLVGIFLLPTLPLLFMRPRRGIIPFTIALFTFFVGILGFRFGIARFSSSASSQLRMISYNIAGRRAVLTRLLARIDSLGVDVAVVVECPGMEPTDRVPPNWFTASHGQTCLYSRYPISAPLVSRDSAEAEITYAAISVRGLPIGVGMVHLTSPHGALLMFNEKSRILQQGPMVRANLAAREADSRRATEFFDAQSTGPMFVAGDFNLPSESAVFRRYWADYADAFEHGGVGFGSTYHYHEYRIRIDHILTRNGISATRSWVGPDLGSDHLPVIADLSLGTPR